MALRWPPAGLQPPQRPLLSNVSGQWLSAAEATDPAYWVRQMRAPVQFRAAVACAAVGEPVWLEVGPGQSLSGLVRQQEQAGGLVVASLPAATAAVDGSAALLERLGRLWAAGVADGRGGEYAGEARRRVALPSYPFERQRYWVMPSRSAAAAAGAERQAVFQMAAWKHESTTASTDPRCRHNVSWTTTLIATSAQR